jgi:Lipase (class 3)
MVLTIDYALMAGRAYQTTRDPINQFPIPVAQGWLEIAHVPNNQNFPQFTGADGFEAVAFQRGNEIVISYAGTNPDDGFVPPGPDNTANILLGLGFSSVQLTQAAEYYLQVQAAVTANNPNTTFTFTGHSLGGGLAALMGVFFGKQAVTFDQAPFAPSATPTLLPGVAETLLSELLTRGYSVTALAGLTDFLQRRAVSGGIPNSDLVSSINVQGELLSTGVPWNITDRIGQSMYIPTNAPGVSGGDLHSQALLTAFLQSMRTASSQRALNDVTYKLTDLMGMIFSRDLYRFDTDTTDRNFLERLVQNETGNAMVTRFTKDLWKLAQEGGLTMTDGSAATNLVSKALSAFAMQVKKRCQEPLCVLTA